MLVNKQTSDHNNNKYDDIYENIPEAALNNSDMVKNHFSMGLCSGNVHHKWDNVKHEIKIERNSEEGYVQSKEILPRQLRCLSLDDHRDLETKISCYDHAQEHSSESKISGSIDNSRLRAKQYSSLESNKCLKKFNPFKMETHLCYQNNDVNGINLVNDPKSIEDIMNDLNLDEPNFNEHSRSTPKKDFQKEKFEQPHFQTMPKILNNDSEDDVRDILLVPKGKCGACGEEIVGKVLMALGRMWHLEHFTCSQCGIQLGTNIFYEDDGRAYCEYDYINIFSQRCAACNEPILERCVTALNKTWHPHHFMCCYCKQQFSEGEYHEMDGFVYCSRDFYYLFARKCFGCGEAIVRSYIAALNQQWHASCFVCSECQEPFKSGSFYGHDGLPFCEQHFNILKKGLCAYCNQMIIGPSITAMGKKYHPGHFVCTFCSQIIFQGTFKEHENKPYCHRCSERLFG